MHTHLNFKFRPALQCSRLMLKLSNSSIKLFQAEIPIQVSLLLNTLRHMHF